MAIQRALGVTLGLGFLVLMLTGCRTTTPNDEYIPIEWAFQGGDVALVDRPDWLNNEHVEKMKAVLERYDEPYRIQGGRLLISSKLKADRELTANYTKKARE